MNVNAILLWKEWRETRVFLLIALGIFVVLPLIGSLENLAQYTHHHIEIEASTFVYPLGGVLAVFVAVGSTCRDLRPRREDFWRSRPVSPVRWMLIKYGMGVLIVEISCLFPLWIEYFASRNTQQMPAQMFWFAFYWVLIYSMAFLCGTLLHRTAHAAVLAFAGLLLIYLLPAIYPPLSWLSILSSTMKEMDVPQASQAAVGALAIAVPLVVLALIAARWQWHIEPGPRFMYGSISAVVLIFLLSAGYHLGTNLPVLQSLDLPPDETIASIGYYQGAVYLWTQTPETYTHNVKGWELVEHNYLRQITLDSAGMKLSGRMPYTWRSTFFPWRDERGGWVALNGDVAYFAELESPANEPAPYYYPNGIPGGVPLDLVTVGYGKDFTEKERIDSLRLPLRSVAKGHDPEPRLYLWKDRLYLIGHALVTVDISDRKKPRLISSTPLGYPEFGDRQDAEYMADADTLVLELPDVPGLPLAQRLDFATRWRFQWDNSLDHDVLCRISDHELQEFHLIALTDKRATFKLVGSVRPSLIDYVFGYGYSYQLHFQNGLLYVSQGYQQGEFNPRISVYETRGSGVPRMIAHFASPGWQMAAAPLPDGRAVIAGKKIWLVGPPPRHD
ncbi:MAG TPA: hypothetical protein VGG19_14750 [Tepidisphaeraceae bacterium]